MTAPEYKTPESHELERDLRWLKRAWDDGSLRALAKAVTLCHHYSHPMPDWVLQAVLALITARGEGFRSGNQTYAEWERQNEIHYTRWSMVSVLRDRKKENPDDLLFQVIDSTWDGCFERVSEELEGTAFAGSPDAIKKSYQLVERLFKSRMGARFTVDSWGNR
jgi:hypothetical protein